MKIIKTKSGGFGQFMRKNGAFIVLGLVVIATCVAVYSGIGKIKSSETLQNNSDINLSGDDKNCSSNSVKNAQRTDAQPQSSSLSSQRDSSSSQSKQLSSSVSQDKPSESESLQQMLFISPVNGKVLNKYSAGKPQKSKTMGDWRLHNGIDYAADEGTSVLCSGEGEVVKIYTDDMWGTTVEIKHPNGMTTVYSSLSDKVVVKQGQKVESGQAIGYVSNTAKIEMSEGSHLHFAVKDDKGYIDPDKIITKAF